VRLLEVCWHAQGRRLIPLHVRERPSYEVDTTSLFPIPVNAHGRDDLFAD